VVYISILDKANLSFPVIKVLDEVNPKFFVFLVIIEKISWAEKKKY
jgi:hypothetical protein